MPLRRRAALVLAAVTTLTALTAPIALADTTPPAATTTAEAPEPPSRSDLYGAADPTYDGVWRQSYTLTALGASGVLPGTRTVSWLLAQQCADGGFPSYRADTSKECDPKLEDTNATGLAVQAMEELNLQNDAEKAAVAWLTKVQNPDGGWSYNPGGNPSDPDSTGVVVSALISAHAPLPSLGNGRTPYHALRDFQFGCAAKPADRGAFGYPGSNGKLTVNAKATADAVRASANASFAVLTPPPSRTTKPAAKAPDCSADKDAYRKLLPSSSATAGVGWLAARITAGGGHLTALTPGATTATPDYGTTADAVVALVAAGRLTEAKAAYAWLAVNSASWSHGNPAALSQLILAARATGDNPRAANGVDLVQQLIALGPAPTKRATGGMSKADEKKDSSSSSTTWIVVGVVFVASIGIGLLISGRKRRRG